MLMLFIQSILILLMNSSLQAMIIQQDQRIKVHTILYQKYWNALEESSSIEALKIMPAPLPALDFDRDTIITRHINKYITSHSSFDSKFIEKITAIPTSLSPQIIPRLTALAFPAKDSRTNDLNYILAELHYKNGDYHQAHSFYTKNEPSYLKTKKAHINAFKSRLIVSTTFDRKDISYLSALAGNIYVELKKIDATHPLLSYKVGLLTQTLLNHNPNMDISNKADIIFKALHHLEYAEKNSDKNAEILPTLTALTKEFYTLLSSIYETKKDPIASLKYLKKTIEYNGNSQDIEIVSILTQSEQKNPRLYASYAPLIHIILHRVYNKNSTLNPKQYNNALLDQFAASEICSQLLPYIETIDPKHTSSDIILLLTKIYNHKIELLLNEMTPHNMYDQALPYIKRLSAYHPDNLALSNKTIKLIHNYVQNHIISNNNLSNEAIEWGCIAADAHIIQWNDNIFCITTDQEKKLAEYLLSAAKMDHINAQFLILPYLNETHLLQNSSYFLPGLYVAHKALFNPKAIDYTSSTASLVNLLKQFVEEGYALPYYILCDYYKNDATEFEKLMHLFSKTDKQYYIFDYDSNDTIKKIYTNCQDILLSYVQPFIENKKSLTGALATFTLGSLYIDGDNQTFITNGIAYLNTATKEILKHKLAHYIMPTQFLLSHAYYKQALIQEKETGVIDLELLRRSALLEYLPAVHKMAQLYIDQQKNNILTLSIKEADFLPALRKEIKKNNSCNSPSVQLYQEYLSLSTAQSNQISAALKEMIQKNDFCSMFKYPDNNEQVPSLLQARRAFEKNNNAKAIALLEKASLKESHPIASILLAQTYLLGKRVSKNYNLSNFYLYEALIHGITSEQFYNIDFAHTLCVYIKDILTTTHPRLAKRYLLSTIKEILIKEHINIKNFYAIFQQVTEIDLLSHSEWINDANKPEIKILNTMMKNLYKDEESSESFEFLLMLLGETQLTDINFISKCASYYPLSSLRLALQQLMGKDCKQDYDQSAKFLSAALSYGITEKKCCNKMFLITLYTYMEIVIQQPENAMVKQHLLTIIKNALKEHALNLSMFQIIFQEFTGINLISIPEWK